MEKLRKRLKEEYFKGMKVDLSDNRIRSFVNNVWHRFTSDYNYFIVMPISEAADLTDIEHILSRSSHGFKVVSPDTIKTIPAGEIGFIVNIDWMNTDKVYMPDELIKLKYIKTVPEIREVYSINNGEGVLSSSYDRAKTLAEILDVPFRSYDKHEFDGTYEMDYSDLVKDVITTYVLRTFGHMDLKLIDSLSKKYGNDIIVAYNCLKAENEFNDEIFINKLIKYISEHENIKR